MSIKKGLEIIDGLMLADEHNDKQEICDHINNRKLRLINE